MGAMQRRKGKVFEREIAAALRPIYGDGVKRTLLSQARSGTEAADLDGTPWSIECKHQKDVTIQGAYRQAQEASKVNGKPPLVISRVDRGPTLVTMGLEDFLQLLKREKECSRSNTSAEVSTPA